MKPGFFCFFYHNNNNSPNQLTTNTPSKSPSPSLSPPPFFRDLEESWFWEIVYVGAQRCPGTAGVLVFHLLMGYYLFICLFFSLCIYLMFSLFV